MDRLVAEDFPSPSHLASSLIKTPLLFCVYSFRSILETRTITTNHLLMLRAVRVSNKLKSWNENQMSHVCAAVSLQPAPPPTGFGAQQVLQGLGHQPRIPWKREAHVGSHVAKKKITWETNEEAQWDHEVNEAWPAGHITQCRSVYMWFACWPWAK